MTAMGGFPTKLAMTKIFQEYAKVLGVTQKVTGHMPRIAGSVRMARAGIELWKIQLFGRWGSNAIMGYIRDVPLATSHTLSSEIVRGLQRARSEEAVVERLVVNLREQVIHAVDTQAAELHKEMDQLRAQMVTTVERDEATPTEDVEADPIGLTFVFNGALLSRIPVMHLVKDKDFAYCGWKYSSVYTAITVDTLRDVDPRCQRCISSTSFKLDFGGRALSKSLCGAGQADCRRGGRANRADQSGHVLPAK